MQPNAIQERSPGSSDFDSVSEETSSSSQEDPYISILNEKKYPNNAPRTQDTISPLPESDFDFDFEDNSLFSHEDSYEMFLHKEKTSCNDPPRPQATISPLSLQRFKLPQIDDVMKLCCKISENSQIEVAVKKSKRGAAAAGGGAFLGGLLGGPPGIFIGGTLGSAVGWWMTRDQFRPLHQIILAMSPQQREKLYSVVMGNLGNLAWDNLSELILSVMSNPSLNKQVLDILESFARKQLRANVKYGKK